MFQFTRPRTWRDNAIFTPPIKAFTFQFTRPRTWRDWRGGKNASHVPVSIHAPTYGARQDAKLRELIAQWFQFTRPRTGRDSELRPVVIKPIVSIHAPTHGARRHQEYKTNHCQRFQFTRPRMGRDLKNEHHPSLPFRVQFTRPRMGRDADKEVSMTIQPVSIHAPTHGARREVRVMLSDRFMGFNSRAHAWGATSTQIVAAIVRTFQFTRPRMGRDLYRG